MFLTPDAKPFWGGTYFPKQPRYGRPGFVAGAGRSIHRAWPDEARRDRATALRALTSHVDARLRRTSRPAARSPRTFRDAGRAASWHDRSSRTAACAARRNSPTPRSCKRCGCAGCAPADTAHRDAVLRQPRPHAATAASTIMSAAACAATRPTRTGSCRISRKCSTTTPMLIRWPAGPMPRPGEQLFRDRIESTSAGCCARCASPGGGFAASLDADSDGEEGKFYTWDAAEIDAVLGARHAGIPRRLRAGAAAQLGRQDPIAVADRRTPQMRGAVLAPLRGQAAGSARETRPRPGRDDKVLADWNGLMIAALAEPRRRSSAAPNG